MHLYKSLWGVGIPCADKDSLRMIKYFFDCYTTKRMHGILGVRVNTASAAGGRLDTENIFNGLVDSTPYLNSLSAN